MGPTLTHRNSSSLLEGEFQPGSGSTHQSMYNNSSSFMETNFSDRVMNTGRPPTYSLFEVILIAIVAGLLSIMTVIGNVMVMISFKMDKQLQTISNYFLLSLAIADFSIGLISMPLFTMYTLVDYWPLGAFICDTWLALDYLNSNASVLNLLIISFDRYFSVTRPLTYRAKRTTKRAAFMIASAWVISLVLWPPWIYAWPYIEGKRAVPDHECYIQFLETNSYVTFGTALAAFYVPVTVMCALYWRIWQETEKRKRDLTHLQAGKRNGSRKSTSSDDPQGEGVEQTLAPPPPQQHLQQPQPQLPGKRSRSASCIADENIETTYVPTSLCVETSKYISRHPKSRPKRLKEICFAWCRIDKEVDAQEDDSTSHGSPSVLTPASVETPIQSSQTTSMNFRPEQLAHLQALMANSQNRPELTLPLGAGSNGPRRTTEEAPSTSRTPVPRPQSTDSVYTIMIRLPTHTPGDEESQASIKMIMEEEGNESEPNMQQIRSSSSMGALTTTCRPTDLNLSRRGSLRAVSDTGVETIRLPLNAKLVHKQVVKPRAPKKKRKQQERKQEKKAAKTLSAILLAFIITWTPYNVLVLIKTLASCADDSCIPAGLWNFSYYLCYINSTINPLCYALCNANFRRTYIRILSCKWHNKKRHITNHGYFS